MHWLFSSGFLCWSWKAANCLLNVWLSDMSGWFLLFVVENWYV